MPSGKISETNRAKYKRRVGAPSGPRTELQKESWQRKKHPRRTPEIWDGQSRVEAVITFLESLPVTKGILEGRAMRLLPDQRAFIEAVYGPRAIPVRIGVRSEPRGNGKTGLVAGLALCHLLGPEAEPRGEIYSAATDRAQAALLFAEMAAILLAVPAFKARVNIQRFHKKIEVLSGVGAGSIYEALCREAPKGHGLAPSLWIYDELAQARDAQLLGALRTGMGKRKRSLGLVISTQAPDDDHPLSRLIDDGLSGGDPTIVVQLTAAPMEADPFDPAVIRAVNPALGIFLDEAIVFAEAAHAKRQPMDEDQYRNLRLNQRVAVAADQRLALASDWRTAEQPVDLATLEGRECYGGLDLSVKQDLSAFVLAFPDEQDAYDVVAWFWTPAGELPNRAAGEAEHLREWIRLGYVEAIPGPIIHRSLVGRQIAQLAQRFAIQAIAYDDWQLADPAAMLDLPHLTWERFGQGHSKGMAGSIRYTNEVIKMGRLRHSGNAALTSSLMSAVIIPDSNGNPKLDKSRSRRGIVRIDGAIALVMALGTASAHVGEHVEGRMVAA